MKSRDPIFLKDTGDKENSMTSAVDLSKDSFAQSRIYSLQKKSEDLERRKRKLEKREKQRQQ